MRTLTAAALTIALLTVTAHAQGKQRPAPQPAPPTAAEQNKPDENAYKSALDRIPASKEVYDPWKNVRPSAPAGTTR
jgi:hypothetical protein